MRLRPGFRHEDGMTLIEILMAMIVLSVGVLSFIGAFSGISKSLRVSKASTLADNLAQEEIESLKNLSYYRLLVTTSPSSASESGLGSFQYDTGYYPPETLTVGQIQFERRVLVQKVTEAAGNIVVNNWYDQDTGLKLITATVVWMDGGSWKKHGVTNLRDNPNRQKIDATFNGNVKSGVANLQDATVVSLQNLVLKGVTNVSGDYSFSVPAGTYDLKATKRGYFPITQTGTVTSGNSQTVSFNLPAMGVGTISGLAYINRHLVISEICAAVNGSETTEYVELYNPTPNDITISTGPGSSTYFLKYYRTSDLAETWITPFGETLFVNTVVPAHGYFVIASVSLISGVVVDAYYSDPTLTFNLPGNRIPMGESGGIRLGSSGYYEPAGTTIDAVGWGRAAPYGPAGVYETLGFQLDPGPGHGGFQPEEVIERMAFSTSTHLTMDGGGDHWAAGNAFDSNNNSTDWVHHTHVDVDTPQNSTMFETARTGTPAWDGAIFSDDGLASTVIIGSTGAFLVTGVATGTWNLTASSSGWIADGVSLTVNQNANTNVGILLLSTPATSGFAGGRVVTNLGVPIPNIFVETSGGWDTTDVNGYYRMSLAIGTFTIVANSGNQDSSFTVGQATGVVVNLGAVTDVPDIVLFQGGILKGFVSTNGTDALPNIPITALSSITMAEVGAVVSDSLGIFKFPDLPVATYIISPQLEVGESASPTSLTSATVSGLTTFIGTFTVTNAFGSLNGVVRKSGSPITTGALIVAVTTGTNLSGQNPPINNQTLRNGATVYYFGSSNSDGTYSISLRGGHNYNVYGWYTTFTGNTPTTTQQIGNVTISPGTAGTVNLTWP